MKASFVDTYKTVGKGKTNLGQPITVFKYEVSGTEAELAQYKEKQGDNYVQDDISGKPLWFSIRPVGQTVTLFVTRNSGRIVADTSEYDAVIALANDHKGTPIGEELARKAADMLFAGLSVRKRTTNVVAAPADKAPL